MCVGDIDYDFTRIFNLLNEKDVYEYNDFEQLLKGYESTSKISDDLKAKWEIYNNYYAFRIYSRMIGGKINRDKKYEEYLKEILSKNREDNKISRWIDIYKKLKS